MKTKLKSILAAALCAVGLTASALQPSPFRDFWSSHPDPRPIKDPTSSIDWGTASMTFESLSAKHGKFLAAAADAMIAAYTARIEKDPTDCEAHICRALAYLKKAGENKMFDDLAKEFGYTFDNDTMHFTGELVHEKGVTPEMNEMSAEVCGILLPLLKSAYEDLCAIPKNWKGSVAITPDVYPVDEAAYFDYADSLGARAALAELMCVLNMVKGFDVTMDSDKLADTFNAINQSNGKRGVQALFENNPDFFSKVRDQKALTEAGDWWASAATLLDQWDKAHCRRSDDKLHFFDWNYEKLDSNGTYGLEWLRRQSAELINLPYWASPLNYEKINGSTQQFTSFKPLFGGKVLRANLPEFGVGVKAPYCNEPLIDTCPDSTICGMWPSVSPIYLATYISTRWTDIPAYTTNTTASVYGIWYKNMFTEGGIGFENEGNPLTFAWDNATPITLLDPEFNVRGVTAVFKGWSGVGRNGNTPITFEGKEIPTPIGEPMKYEWRRMELTANFEVPKVTYLDFDETTGKLVERTAECEIVTEKTTTLTTGKVYVVVGDVTIENLVKVLSTPESPAKLVLCDEATLAATKGVDVAAGNALTLCGQVLGTGTLEATGSSGAAGIGGGTVTINGGTVMATGGSSSAGISGTVTINAGTVTAAGSDGAAGIAGTVKFGANYACGVAAGADEANALYRAAAAYAADPSAAYVALPYFSLKIPEATEGYSYEVSSMGVQPKAALANKVNTYAIATGATVRVRFTFDGEDYVWVKEPADNPMIIANISGDTVVDAADLPTAKFSKKGSAGNPWAVGKTTLDSVTAYTSGAGGLVVEGEGDMQDFTSRDPAPWGTGVSEVEIGEDVTSIGARAFADSQLGRVTIPASVTNIGAAAFAGSTSLSSVAVEAMTPPALGEGAFVELAEDYKIYVPQGTVETYKAAPGWRDYADRIVEGIPGSPVWPWKVGTPKAADVTAYTNGVGKLVVEGWGDIRDFDPPSDSAPWGTDIAEVKIDEDVTSIGANAFADCMSLTNMVVEAMTPPVLGDDALSGCAAIETIYVPYGTSGAYKKAPGWNDFAENIVELPEPIAAESDEFAVDLRTRIEFEEGKTRIDVVTWSATAWGAVPGSKYTDLGFTNKTTGATGVIAEGLVGENLDDCPLPEKDGEYLLTHSTGDLKSFVTFVVSGYPLGCESNPWTVGPADDPERTVAWKDGKDAIVYLKPPRSAVSRAGLETLTNAMGGVNFAVGLVTADGTATNEVKMIIGASGKQYTKLKDMLESDDDSWTFYDVTGYWVSYAGGEGASGTMETDMFVPGVRTNLTANAFEIVGYGFTGWTKNGVDVAYTNCEAGVDFAQPGETLALTALWEQVATEPADFDDLTNMIARATRPMTITLNADVVLPAGGKIVIPADKDVTFAGEGKFDVSGIMARFRDLVVVAEGVADVDLARFDAKGVSMPAIDAESGKIVLIPRGVSEDFPWVLDEESGVTAWVDPVLTNLAAVVIDDGLPVAMNPIDLVALTNAIVTYGYVPEKAPFNALLKVSKDGGAPEYVKPFDWIGEAGRYTTLEAALLAGETTVIPNFVTEETPAEIVESGEGADGQTYTAVVANDASQVESNAVKAVYAEGLIGLATTLNTNVTLKVVSQDPADIEPATREAVSDALVEASSGGKGYDSVAFVDLSIFFNAEKQNDCELGALITLHIPWPVEEGGLYGVARMHAGVAQAIPEGEENAVDGEFFTVDLAAGEIVLRVNKFSDYAIGSTGATNVPAFGTVKYPKVTRSTGYIKEGTNATWTAKAGEGCVFAGWAWTNGTPAASFALLSENERRNKKLKVKVTRGDQILPTDVAASWVWLDEDRIQSVELTPSNLVVVCRSYVTATVSGLPSGLKFNRKSLAITGAPRKDETKTVKVSVKNASGYTWKQSFSVTVAGGAVTSVVPADNQVLTGEPVVLWGDTELGKVKGSKVYVAGKKASLRATPAKGSVFLGWYEDAAFRNAATNLPKGYLAASQSVVVPAEGLKLFARFVELEDWTVGTFDGVYFEMEGGTNAVESGTVTFTVSTKGKVSGKTLVGGKSSSFKAASLDDAIEAEDGGLVFYAHPTMKVDGVERTLTLRIFESKATGLGLAEICYGEEKDAPYAEAVQNGWKLKPSALPAFPSGKASIELSVTNGVDLALKFGAKGKVTVKGAVDGTKVSAKAQVLPVALREGAYVAAVCVYAPKAGFCKVYDVLLTVGADGKFAAASIYEKPEEEPKTEPDAFEQQATLLFGNIQASVARAGELIQGYISSGEISFLQEARSILDDAEFNLVENVMRFAASSTTISAEKKAEIDGYVASLVAPLLQEVQVRGILDAYPVAGIEDAINAKKLDGAQELLDCLKEAIAAAKQTIEESKVAPTKATQDMLAEKEAKVVELQQKIDEAKPAEPDAKELEALDNLQKATSDFNLAMASMGAYYGGDGSKLDVASAQADSAAGFIADADAAAKLSSTISQEKKTEIANLVTQITDLKARIAQEKAKPTPDNFETMALEQLADGLDSLNQAENMFNRYSSSKDTMYLDQAAGYAGLAVSALETAATMATSSTTISQTKKDEINTCLNDAKALKEQIDQAKPKE